MIRVVLDTNILISAILSKNSTPDKVLTYAIDHTEILSSEATYQELETKLLSNKFDKYVLISTRKTFLTTFLDVAVTVPIKTSLSACRDDKDNQILELAIDGKADCVVTGDKDLLVLHPFAEIDIITAANFLTKYGPRIY